MVNVQVLFEYKDSRQQLSLSPNSFCEVIGEELSKFGCPAPVVRLASSEGSVQPASNEYLLPQLLVSVARHEFMVKPLGALYALHSGVPEAHRGFWNTFSVEQIFELHVTLNAMPATVISRIEEPEQTNSAGARVFSYLTRFIGNMKKEELRRFLRFVTGSSVLIDISTLIVLQGSAEDQ